MTPPLPPVPETWFSRDLPVLISIVANIEASGSATKAQIQADTRLDDRALDQAIRALQEDGYCETYFEGGGNFGVMQITGRARRATGSWPNADSLADQLGAALARAVDNAPNEDERTRRRKVLDAVTGAGRDIFVQASAAVIGQAAGGTM